MKQLFETGLASLMNAGKLSALARNKRGIEREALRVTIDGSLATTPHPVGLGSALTHPSITTDYSESLLELITAPSQTIESVFKELDLLHRFIYSQIGDEILWAQSMPGTLPDEEAIPIAWYGTSPSGQFKHIYRQGLAKRYGRRMQCIAGLHYNFSFDSDFLQSLLALDEQVEAAYKRRSISDCYFSMIRNYHRYSWLLLYLFGSSPAVHAQFLDGRDGHGLDRLSPDTLYLPYATSLRMSRLGYQNQKQAAVVPSLNSLGEYIRDVGTATSRRLPEYETIGIEQDGKRIQLNSYLLQFESELYASIRPKRTPNQGERPLRALQERGVEYVEVRCLDIDPLEPIGISRTTAAFLDAFLLYCALEDSPPFSGDDAQRTSRNMDLVSTQGRRPGLLLDGGDTTVPLVEWASELINKVYRIAELLDAETRSGDYRDAIRYQSKKLSNSEETPSARILSALPGYGNSLQRCMLDRSITNSRTLRGATLTIDERDNLSTLASRSLMEQKQLEANSTEDFPSYLARFLSPLQV